MTRVRVEIYTEDVEIIFSEWVEIPETETGLMPASALLEATNLALFQMRKDTTTLANR